MKIVKPMSSCESCGNCGEVRKDVHPLMPFIGICKLWSEPMVIADSRPCKFYFHDGSTAHPCSPCPDREHCQPELNRKCKTARSKK